MPIGAESFGCLALLCVIGRAEPIVTDLAQKDQAFFNGIIQAGEKER